MALSRVIASSAATRSLTRSPRLPQPGEHFAEAVKACFQVFDDLFGEVVGFGLASRLSKKITLALTPCA